MKKIEVNRTVSDIMYEAVDGTRFYVKEECDSYEKSAKGVIREKLSRIAVTDKNATEIDLFNVGSDDSKVIGVVIETEGDRDAALQLFFLDHEYLLTEANKNNPCKVRAVSLINQAYEKKDVLLIGINYEGNCYIIDTRNNIINRLNNLTK